MCCLNPPGNCYSHKNVVLCENYYFPQRLPVFCLHWALPIYFDLCPRQQGFLIHLPYYLGLNLTYVSVCSSCCKTTLVLDSPAVILHVRNAEFLPGNEPREEQPHSLLQALIHISLSAQEPRKRVKFQLGLVETFPQSQPS